MDRMKKLFIQMIDPIESKNRNSMNQITMNNNILRFQIFFLHLVEKASRRDDEYSIVIDRRTDYRGNRTRKLPVGIEKI